MTFAFTLIPVTFTLKPDTITHTTHHTSSPFQHNIYLHSALVLSRDIDRSDPKEVEEACKYNTIESALSLAVSFFVNLTVVAVFASSFFSTVCAEAGWNSFTVPVSAPHSPPVQHTNLGCLAAVESTVSRAPGAPGAPRALGAVSFGGNITASGTGTSTSLSLNHPRAIIADATLVGCRRLANTSTLMPCVTGGGLPGHCCEIGLASAGNALQAVLGDSARVVFAVGLLAAGQASTMTYVHGKGARGRVPGEGGTIDVD